MGGGLWMKMVERGDGIGWRGLGGKEWDGRGRGW